MLVHRNFDIASGAGIYVENFFAQPDIMLPIRYNFPDEVVSVECIIAAGMIYTVQCSCSTAQYRPREVLVKLAICDGFNPFSPGK